MYMFPKVYVINMDKSTERLKKIGSSLDAMGVPFERISGSDECRARASGFPINAYCSTSCPSAVIGCAHSHVRAWQAFLDTDEEYAIILEDDATFTDDFVSRIQDVLNSGVDFDLIQLGCSEDCGKIHGKPFSLLLKLVSFFVGQGKEKVQDGLYNLDTMFGAHAYLVSKRGAKRLLKNLERSGISWHIDVHIGIMKNLKKLAIIPSISNQRLSVHSSTIASNGNGNVSDEKETWFTPFIWLLHEPQVQFGKTLIRLKHIIIAVVAFCIATIIAKKKKVTKRFLVWLLGVCTASSVACVTAARYHRRKHLESVCGHAKF